MVGKVNRSRQRAGEGLINMVQVSVIIPCYQQGALLGEAIESVLAQTRPAAEIIVVDDGSTDTTAAVANRYLGEQAGRVRLLRQANSGQARARQAGFLVAGGDWVILLDADDLVEPEAIAAHERALERRRGADVLAGDAVLVGENGHDRLGFLRQTRRARWPGVLRSNPYGSLAAMMVRAESIRRVGGLAVEGVPGAEDWDLWARMTRVGMRFEPTGATVARYRQSGASYSRRLVTMLDAMLDVVACAAREDTRLEGLSAREPIDPAWHARLRNVHVFAMLGRAVGQQAGEALGAVLDRLDGRAVDALACHDEFLGNLQYALRQTGRAVVPEAIAAQARGLIEIRMHEVFAEATARRLTGMVRADLAQPWRKRSLRGRLRDRIEMWL